MEARAETPPAASPGEATRKKRPLEIADSDDESASSAHAEPSGPGQKRRKTSSGSSAGPKKAQGSDVPAGDGAFEPPLHGSIGSDAGAAASINPDAVNDEGGVTRRVTRSQSRSAASSSTGATSTTTSTTDANVKKKDDGKKKAKKTKQQKKAEAASSGLPTDPCLLSGPPGDDAWKLRFTVFRKELQKTNPGLTLTPTVLSEQIRRYFKLYAFRRQSNRQQQVHEAKKALLKLELSGGLQSVIADDEKAAETEDQNEQISTAKGSPAWVYPSNPLLLDPDYPAESFEDRLKRLCQTIVDGDAVGASRFTRPWLEKMAIRWVARKGWTNAGASRSQKIEEATRNIQTLSQSGKLAEIIQSVLGPRAATNEDAATPDSDEESIAERPCPTGATPAPDAQGSAAAQSGADASGQPPSASDWAALLGSDAASAEAGEEDRADAESVDTSVQRPAAGGRAIMSEEESSAEMQRYFPGLDASATFCVVCATDDHTAVSCIRSICRHCSGEHFSWGCPGRRRCTKCRQLGHGAAVCTEKLAMAEDEEGMECGFCASKGHLEDECDNIWRSYLITMGAQKKVRHIPAFCSACGIEGHYSSDCTLRGDWGLSATWCLANRSQYIDPASENEAISATSAAAASAPTDMGHQIKGAASKNTHIFFDDSDGSEEGEFIGTKVAPKVSAGPIRMSTNIQFTSLADPPPPPPPPFQGQPPLPPGPPPPGPPPSGPASKPGGYSRLAQPPQGRNQLPPRPRGGIQMSAGRQANGPPPMAPLGPSKPGNDGNRVNKPNGGPPQRGRGRGWAPRRGRGGR